MDLIEVIYHRHPCRNDKHNKKTDCLNEKIHYLTETLTLKVTSNRTTACYSITGGKIAAGMLQNW